MSVNSGAENPTLRYIHPKRAMPKRADPGLSPGPGADRRSRVAAADRIRILSYNVLGARQGLSEKHGHVGVDVSRDSVAFKATERSCVTWGERRRSYEAEAGLSRVRLPEIKVETLIHQPQALETSSTAKCPFVCVPFFLPISPTPPRARLVRSRRFGIGQLGGIGLGRKYGLTTRLRLVVFMSSAFK